MGAEFYSLGILLEEAALNFGDKGQFIASGNLLLLAYHLQTEENQ